MRKLLLTLIVFVAFLTITTDVGNVTFSRNTDISRNLHYLDIKTPLSYFNAGSGNLFNPKNEPAPEPEDPSKPKPEIPEIVAVDNLDIRRKAVEFAYAQLGKRYSYGSIGPDTFDCSGLLYTAYKKSGMVVERTTFLMRKAYKEVPAEQAQPGDFFIVKGHVGMYVGNGKIIEAAGQGEVGSVKENVITNKWWQARNPVFINPFKRK